MKKILTILLLSSCSLFRHPIPNPNQVTMTNQEQTDNIVKLQQDNLAIKKEIDSIKKFAVFIDTGFFKVNNKGIFTFKSRITFDTVAIGALYIGKNLQGLLQQRTPAIDTLRRPVIKK